MPMPLYQITILQALQNLNLTSANTGAYCLHYTAAAIVI